MTSSDAVPVEAVSGAGFTLPDGLSVRTAPPYFITGSGRCGTTLLRRMLLERTDTVIPPENYIMRLTRRLSERAGGSWDALVDTVVEALAKIEGDWATFNLDGAELSRLLHSVPSQYRTPDNVWHVFAALYGSRNGRPSFARWGDKTPLNVRFVPDLVALYPECQFVFLVRDPVDMAYSHGQMESRRGEYMAGAERWVAANTEVLAAFVARPTACRIVRYEDLVASPDATLAGVVSFLGLLEHDPTDASSLLTDVAQRDHLRHAVDEVSTTSVGKGHREMDPQIREEILKITAGLRPIFGYGRDRPEAGSKAAANPTSAPA